MPGTKGNTNALGHVVSQEARTAIANKLRGQGQNEKNPRWAGDKVSYRGIHKRKELRDGKAKDYFCIDDCGYAAFHWSYNSALGERVNLDAYEPRCVRCHKRFDAK